MRIFLSGPMGSGKSTVARAVAARSGLLAWDLDSAIEQRAGKSVAGLFAERGEAGFRALERDVLQGLLRSHSSGVFALGGGTVTDRELRRQLLREGVLVTLRADVDELARRVGSGHGRPLLSGQDVAQRLRGLVEARREAYAECHVILDSASSSIEALAESVLRAAEDPPLIVPLGERSYRVEVGAGVRARLPLRVAEVVAPGARVVVVTDDVVGPLWSEAQAAALRARALQVSVVTLSAGEQHKTLRSAEQIWEAALHAGIDRGSVVVGIGGGVVGDLSGFAASTLLRGIPVGHVPTTLLAMVDSAIGGKTGFDTSHGKNLIGTFHQPSFVLCDTEVLATLPLAERRSGLAEVVKSAWIAGEAEVAQLEADASALHAGEAQATIAAIRMAATLKARIVTEDERESGARALLNLGHTVGHAIEASQGYAGFRHGEAVALGMVAAFRLGVRLGLTAPAELERVVGLLSALGLPTQVGPYLRKEVLTFIGSDKKRRADSVRFVLPRAPGQVEPRSIALDQLFGLLTA